MLSWIAEAPIAIVPVGVIAIAERLAYTLSGHIENRDTELRNVALSWARTGRLADAFRDGSGPTTHAGALPPLIPGTAFWLLGDTPAAAIALTILSGLTVVLTALVLNRAFARLGTPSAIRGAAMILICAVPLHLELEARSLRVYENGSAALVVAMLLLAVVRLDQRGRVGIADMIGLSALTAFVAAISPVAGMAGIVMLGILALRRMGWRERGKALAILVLVLMATTLPWAIRNREVVGETILTRGNFGLEFALGTHPAAVDPRDPGSAYIERLAQIHPHQSDPPYRAMIAVGGELSYARLLDEETRAWVAGHPGEAIWIWSRHWLEFFFPPPWLWMHTATPDATMPARMIAVDLIALFGLAGLILALLRRQGLYAYVAVLVVVLPLPYILSQPLVRYRYVLSSLLVFLAADCLARLLERVQRSKLANT